ncbi:metallophosphoesterase [Porphyromonadaceae bacterium]
MYLRIVFSLIAFLFLFNGVVDYYLYRTLVKPLRNRKITLLHWGISLLFLLGVVSISIHFVSGQMGLRQMMWFTFVYFLIYIPKLTFSLFSIPALFIKRAAKPIRIFSFVLSILIFAGFLFGLTLGKTYPRVKRVTIVDNRLPASLSPLRVVQISDAHVGNMGECFDIMERVANEIELLNPDLVLFTGDLVNSRSEEVMPFIPTLSRIKARYGVYAVLGNHDYSDYARFATPEEKQTNFDALVNAYPLFGWTLLNNESVQIHSDTDSIAIVGVENWGEPPFSQHGDLDAAMEGLSDNQFKILLSHNPEHWRKTVQLDDRIDLTLSGHTHAMQFKLKLGSWQWSPAEWKYPLWSGLYTGEVNKLYVNDGLGYVFIPFRFGTRPEITLITIESGSGK